MRLTEETDSFMLACPVERLAGLHPELLPALALSGSDPSWSPRAPSKAEMKLPLALV